MKPDASPKPSKPQATTTEVVADELAPQRAVQEYLNALLQEATTQAKVEDAQVTTPTVTVAPSVEALVQVPEPVAPPVEPQPLVEPPVKVASPKVDVAPPQVKPAEPQVSQAEPALVPKTADEPSQESQVWTDGRPPWAQERFECLLFKVAGLTLAVPLVELGGVLVMEDEMRPLFGQPDWFLGLLPSKTAGTVKTVNTARWVMQEKCPDNLDDSFKYVIRMEGSDWGMACHSVEDAITLEPHQVRWRSDRGRRPWLAGTVIEHMCAIMDISALLALLQQSNAGNSNNR